MTWIIGFIIGALTGILSAVGVGGGSILLICLTLIFHVEQQTAQAVNLLYFLPVALTALPSHIKHGYVDKNIAKPAILAGLICSIFASCLSNHLDGNLLRKLFAVFLFVVGIVELFRKKRRSDDG